MAHGQKWVTCARSYLHALDYNQLRSLSSYSIGIAYLVNISRRIYEIINAEMLAKS